MVLNMSKTMSVNIDDPLVDELLRNLGSYKPVSKPVKKIEPELVKYDVSELMKNFVENRLQFSNLIETEKIYDIKTKDKLNDLDWDQRDMMYQIQKSISKKKDRVRKQFDTEIKIVKDRQKLTEAKLF